MGISRLEDVAEMYVVFSLEVLFDLVGVAQVLYLFVECQLEVLLELVDVALVLSLYVVYSLVVLLVLRAMVLPLLRPETSFGPLWLRP